MFKHFLAFLSVRSLFPKVKLLGKSRFELVWEPSIAEIWKYHACYISSQLNQLKVTWHLLFNPLVLDFHSHKLAFWGSLDVRLVDLGETSRSQRLFFKVYINYQNFLCLLQS